VWTQEDSSQYGQSLKREGGYGMIRDKERHEWHRLSAGQNVRQCLRARGRGAAIRITSLDAAGQALQPCAPHA